MHPCPSCPGVRLDTQGAAWPDPFQGSQPLQVPTQPEGRQRPSWAIISSATVAARYDHRLLVGRDSHPVRVSDPELLLGHGGHRTQLHGVGDRTAGKILGWARGHHPVPLADGRSGTTPAPHPSRSSPPRSCATASPVPGSPTHARLVAGRRWCCSTASARAWRCWPRSWRPRTRPISAMLPVRERSRPTLEAVPTWTNSAGPLAPSDTITEFGHAICPQRPEIRPVSLLFISFSPARGKDSSTDP